MIRNNDNNDNDDDEDRRQFYLERLEYWEKFMKSKAAGCGSISTLISSIVLLCVSSVIIIRPSIFPKFSTQRMHAGDFKRKTQQTSRTHAGQATKTASNVNAIKHESLARHDEKHPRCDIHC